MRLPTGTRIGYLIDAQNRRIAKTVNDTLTKAWLYQGQLTPVAELDGSGAVVSRFVYATGVNVPDYMVRADSTYRLVRDHLGSVRIVVNVASGSIAQRLTYDEFGIETENTNPGWQPFGYAGGLTESRTGLVRFGARDYDPVAGRWTAKDPIGFAGGTTSLYSYVDNDPVNSLDPTGEIAPAVAVAMVVGFTVGFGLDVVLQLAANGGNLREVSWSQASISGAVSTIPALRLGYQMTLKFLRPTIGALSGAEVVALRNAVKRSFRVFGFVDDAMRLILVGKRIRNPWDSFARINDTWSIWVAGGWAQHWQSRLENPFGC